VAYFHFLDRLSFFLRVLVKLGRGPNTFEEIEWCFSLVALVVLLLLLFVTRSSLLGEVWVRSW